MRAAFRTSAVAVAIVLTSAASGCVPDTTKEAGFLKPPASWDPLGAGLTFGKANLEAFNALGASEREAHLEALKGKPGSFKGQGRFQRATELSAQLEDAALGKYEAFVTVTEPVLFEITIDYHLYAPERLGHGLPPGTYVGFTGTLASLQYQDETKPRKLEIKVKDVTLERLED